MAHSGLVRARAILKDRRARIEELKKQGKKIVGYLSIHVPLEIISGLDMIPFRIIGDIREPVTEADKGLPAAFCPYMRSVLDLAIKGKFGFLDGFIMNHTCDAQEKTVRVLTSFVKFPFVHFLDMPSTVNDYAVDYYRKELADFKQCLEDFAGKKLDDARLNEMISIYNEQRALVRRLYALKRPDPPLISGRETLEVVMALQSLPVQEGNELLREVIAEVEERRQGGPSKKARILVWGSVIDDPVFLDAIESSGANVVMDDLDEGTKPYWNDVGADGDPLHRLAERYLTGIRAARTFRDAADGEPKKDHFKDLSVRYGYLKSMVEEWKVDGVLLQSLRYCDPHGYELVDVMDYFHFLDVPAIYVEHTYSEGSLAPIRTRVEGFVETLE
ncbi:MAG: 2-hydroxyacyl-CoA dehydratase [Deltaproteobacteria bacterium]|nr:2-hydroxyacyl-CoA dehydratase [Deltaproteobacteria bacterium]